MEVSYLDEIHHSVYRQFISVIDHLNYHPSMNNTKCTMTYDQADTKVSHAETLHRKCNIYSDPYTHKREYDELIPSKEVFLVKLL